MVVDLRRKENLWHGPLTTWAATDTSKSTWIEQTELEDQKWCCVAEGWRADSSFWWSPDTEHVRQDLEFYQFVTIPLFILLFSPGGQCQCQRCQLIRKARSIIGQNLEASESMRDRRSLNKHGHPISPAQLHTWGRLHYRYYLCYIFFINVLLTLMCINVLTLPLKKTDKCPRHFYYNYVV